MTAPLPGTVPQGALPHYPPERTSGIEPPPALFDLLAAGPVHRVRMAGGAEAWLVTGYHEVRAVLSDPAFGTQYPGVVPTADVDNLAGGFMFLKDPPEHTRLRRNVSRAFTARRVAEMEQRATAIAAGLADGMLADGPVADLQERFAYPLPITIISELLGIPEGDRGRFVGWADIVLRSHGADPAATATAFADLQRFVVDLVDGKPDGTDLLSELAGRRDTADGLTRVELASMAMGLLMAGYVTTASAIGHGMLRLFGRPDVLTGLRTGELAVAPVVEELLRLQDEEIGILRIAQEDTRIRGVAIARGDTVIASRSSANRDAAEYDDPQTLDPGVERSGHLAFGHGVHHCLGAALARMELAVALHTLVHRFPGLRLAVEPHEVPWHAEGMDVTVERLPVTW